MSIIDVQVEAKLYREFMMLIITDYLDSVVSTSDIDWAEQYSYWKDTRVWSIACMATVAADSKTIEAWLPLHQYPKDPLNFLDMEVFTHLCATFRSFFSVLCDQAEKEIKLLTNHE